MKYKVNSTKFAFPVRLRKRTTFYFAYGDKAYLDMEAVADFDCGHCFITDKKTGILISVPMQGNVIYIDLGEKLDGSEKSNLARNAILTKARAAKKAKAA